MKINIILRINPFFENSASANRWCSLIDGLARQGAKISIFITRGYHSPNEWKRMGRKGERNNIKYHYLNFLFHHYIWLRRINNYILIPIKKPFIFLALKRIALKNPDAICWTDSTLESFKLALELKKQNPHIRTFLEMSEFLDIHLLNRGRALHKLAGDRRKKLFEKHAFFAYDGLALMTNTLMDYYSHFPTPGPKLFHLPMTVDLERFDKPLQVLEGFKKPYIAFVGVMNNAKDGVDILIKAFARITEEFPVYRLYLIGPWNYDTPSHLQIIRELGLEDKIFWKGQYNRDDIPAIIKNASILVLPRPNSKQAQGGFPTKLGEYLATSKPVCATIVGEIPDYLVNEESVYFANPGSSESFADAMRRALSNPEEAEKIGQNGRKVAEKYFDKNVQAKILFDFFKEQL